MRIIITFFLLCLGGASHAQISQKSRIKGLNVSASAHMIGWTSAYFNYLDENAPNGGGGGLAVGYGITELLEPYAAIHFSSMGVENVDVTRFSFTHADLGLKLNFLGTIHAWRPFVMAGYTLRTGNLTEVNLDNQYPDAKVYGGTPHFGGGLSYFFTESLSIFANALFTTGKKSNLKVDGIEYTDKPDLTTFRLGLGLQYHIR